MKHIKPFGEFINEAMSVSPDGSLQDHDQDMREAILKGVTARIKEINDRNDRRYSAELNSNYSKLTIDNIVVQETEVPLEYIGAIATNPNQSSLPKDLYNGPWVDIELNDGTKGILRNQSFTTDKAKGIDTWKFAVKMFKKS